MNPSRRLSFNRKEVGKSVSPQTKSKIKPLGEDVLNFYKKYENKKTKWIKTLVNGQIFRLPDYYQIYKQIGIGSYGSVVAAIDCRQQKTQVAIKKMTNVFQHKIFCRRILREIRILRLLKLENIIDIKTIILPRSRKEFSEIYVVFPLMDFDLGTILRSPIVLNQEYCQFYLYQILRGLKFIHSANIMHRDLKTRNILVDDDNDLKICDFGLSRFADQSLKCSALTEYVTTRWYRAPQILLGSDKYTKAVDIWSAGCIFAQIITKKPFLQANSTKSQLQLIMKTLKIEKNGSQYLEKSLDGQALKKIFPQLSAQGCDLLKQMLKFHPQQRITAQKALSHEYLKHLHVQQDQPTCQPINELQFEFEDVQLTIQQLKDILYEQILLYHFEDFRKQYQLKKTKKQSLIKHIIQSSNSKIIDPVIDYTEK